MANKKWSRYYKTYGVFKGPRAGTWGDVLGFDDLDWMNVEDILSAMEKGEFLSFEYKGSVRLVAPFVLGVSYYGNGLLRGYQVEGLSYGVESEGWRIFQIRLMSLVKREGMYFFVEDFDYIEYFPWTYKVIKQLEGVKG